MTIKSFNKVFVLLFVTACLVLLVGVLSFAFFPSEGIEYASAEEVDPYMPTVEDLPWLGKFIMVGEGSIGLLNVDSGGSTFSFSGYPVLMDVPPSSFCSNTYIWVSDVAPTDIYWKGNNKSDLGFNEYGDGYCFGLSDDSTTFKYQSYPESGSTLSNSLIYPFCAVPSIDSSFSFVSSTLSFDCYIVHCGSNGTYLTKYNSGDSITILSSTKYTSTVWYPILVAPKGYVFWRSGAGTSVSKIAAIFSNYTFCRKSAITFSQAEGLSYSYRLVTSDSITDWMTTSDSLVFTDTISSNFSDFIIQVKVDSNPLGSVVSGFVCKDRYNVSKTVTYDSSSQIYSVSNSKVGELYTFTPQLIESNSVNFNTDIYSAYSYKFNSADFLSAPGTVYISPQDTYPMTIQVKPTSVTDGYKLTGFSGAAFSLDTATGIYSAIINSAQDLNITPVVVQMKFLTFAQDSNCIYSYKLGSSEWFSSTTSPVDISTLTYPLTIQIQVNSIADYYKVDGFEGLEFTYDDSVGIYSATLSSSQDLTITPLLSTTIPQSLLDVWNIIFTSGKGVVNWFVNTFIGLAGIFYTPASESGGTGSLTFVGVFAIIALVVTAAFIVVNWVISVITFRRE